MIELIVTITFKTFLKEEDEAEVTRKLYGGELMSKPHKLSDLGQYVGGINERPIVVTAVHYPRLANQGQAMPQMNQIKIEMQS